MTEDNWYQQSDDSGMPGDAPGPAPKRGMSTGMKVFIGLMIVAGVMVLACCGGIFWVGSRVAGMATDDPAKVQAIQEEIAGIDLPEGWEAQGGFDGGMFGFEMKSAIHQRGDAMFMMMQFNMPGQQNNEQMRKQFRQGMQQQGQNTEIDVESSEERTLTVAGEDTVLDFVKGTDTDGNAVRQVTGTFTGRGGPAILLYQSPEEDWNEEVVVQMIESIRK